MFCNSNSSMRNRKVSCSGLVVLCTIRFVLVEEVEYKWDFLSRDNEKVVQ